MGHGQPQPLDGGTLSPEKPEDKLAKKANDSLQGDVSKQGFEGLNSQVSQQSQQEKLDRNLTLDQQLQKNGTVKIGIITRNFNCSVEITGTDPKIGKPIEYVRGRSPDEVARAKEAEAQNPQQKRADQEQAYKDKYGHDADKPIGVQSPLTDPQLDQIANYLTKNPQEKPVLVAYGNDTASDAAPNPGQVYNAVQNDAKTPGVGWTPLEDHSSQKIKIGNQEYNPDDVTAQDWGAMLKKGLDRGGRVAKDHELGEWENPPDGGDGGFPHRGREDEFIDYDSCAKANKSFPELSKYLGDGPGKVDPDLIAATIRNEQFYYKNVFDTGPDHYIRAHGNWPFEQNESIGPAQIQVRNINQFAKEYPKQLGSEADAVSNAETVQHAPIFVGAYFNDVIHGIETKQKPDFIPEKTWQQVNDYWKKGQCNEALIIAYNPDPKQINHVFTQLDNIKAPDWD